ncbi:hypothetical protein Tco_0236806 [Tanacetum coccineum]
MTMYRNNQLNNFSVDSDFTLKRVGFSELLELKDKAAKKISPGATLLLKNIEAKFNCDRETAEKLKIPPPPQLSETEPTTSAKKRKRQQEHHREIFVTENVVVDGMFKNLVLTKEITASVHGQVIEEPKCEIIFRNRNTDYMFPRANELVLASTTQLIRLLGIIKQDSAQANIFINEINLIIETRHIQVRDIVKEVEDYLKTYSSAEMENSCYVEGMS